MPLFLIEKDSATKIPKDCSEEEAQAFLEQGFGVQRIGENGEMLPFAAEVAEEVAEVATDESASEEAAPARKAGAKKGK